ncbi:MAG: c-type cytochrome [bacterium]|nr:c-type cytochrome [bacterium]
MMLRQSLALFAVGVAAFVGILAALNAADEKTNGKDVFLKYKCDNCHSVSSAGIEGKNKKMVAPDLLDVTARHEAEWIPRFIRKEEGAGHVRCDKVPKERDGKPHMLKFAGTKEEEDALLAWFAEQRTKEEEEEKK